MAEPQQRMALPEEFDQASIIASCTNALPEDILDKFGHRVIKISDHHVVKRGIDVCIEEAENLRIAYELLDSRIVRVPRVFGFFTHQDKYGCRTGYILMEFVKGKVINPLDDEAIEKVASVIKYLATFKNDIPGPLGGGPSRGILFDEYRDIDFGSLDGMDEWFNSRILPHNPKLNLKGCELVLCHLDIAPRNIMWQEDGTLCLVDWASAGFYPRLFEFCEQWIMEGKDGDFNSKILNLMEPLSDHELAQKDGFLCAWGNIQRYAFRTKEEKLRDALDAEAVRMKYGIPPRTGPAPVHPMPPYPPEWLEEAKRQGMTFTEPNSVESPSQLPAPGNPEEPQSWLVRFFSSIFYPFSWLSPRSLLVRFLGTISRAFSRSSGAT